MDETVYEKKKFKCEMCGSIFSRKYTMKIHVESVHEKKKPFKCEMCDYICYEKSNMKKHIEVVHDKKKPFKCEICDYSCYQKSKMKKHVESDMRRRNHSNVKSATIVAPKIVT